MRGKAGFDDLDAAAWSAVKQQLQGQFSQLFDLRMSTSPKQKSLTSMSTSPKQKSLTNKREHQT
eukprot:4214593-Amphidinium_carterae.1